MTARTKGHATQLNNSPRPAGQRVARNKWAEIAHLPDEEIVAKGIPMRMIRRLRRRA
jgi:hypothetical protein